MDERQVHSKTHHANGREAGSLDPVATQGFAIVGWREHEVLIAEGHYRCPQCRRADATEMNAASPIRR